MKRSLLRAVLLLLVDLINVLAAFVFGPLLWSSVCMGFVWLLAHAVFQQSGPGPAGMTVGVLSAAVVLALLTWAIRPDRRPQ